MRSKPPQAAMDLTSIRYFVHVAEVGSITIAARDLRIAQPALTRRIQRLEDDSGAQLLLRLPRGVQLTAVGREFLEHCRRILREVALAEDSLAVNRSRPGGHVALGIPGTLTALIVPRLIERMRDRSPKLTLSVTEGTTPYLYDNLLAGRSDLAILNNPQSSRAIRLLPLTSETLVVVAPAQTGHTRRFFTLNELACTPVIVTKGIRAMVDEQIRAHGKRLIVDFEISSPEAIRRLLLQGIGPTIVPVSTFRDDIWAGRLAAFPMEDVNLHRMLSLCHVAEGATPAVQAVARIIQADILDLTSQGVFNSIPDRAGQAGAELAAKQQGNVNHQDAKTPR
jgi:LysR family transcriptional regulator, nitrogen assimilation regulatory protein